MPNALRMTIGSAEANEATIAALAAFLAGQEGAVNDDPIFRRLALIGIGLIGSSIALAARKAGAVGHIAISSADARRRCSGPRNCSLGDSYHADPGRGGARRRLRHPLHAGRRLRRRDRRRSPAR